MDTFLEDLKVILLNDEENFYNVNLEFETKPNSKNSEDIIKELYNLSEEAMSKALPSSDDIQDLTFVNVIIYLLGEFLESKPSPQQKRKLINNIQKIILKHV